MTVIDFRGKGINYIHYKKNCVGAGYANEDLRAAFQRYLLPTML